MTTPDSRAREAAQYLAALTAERDALLSQIAGLQAARFAYASEFALDAEGQPDVGAIHQNIRALKDAARLALKVVEELTEHEPQCGVFDLDDDGAHCACTCGLITAITALKAVL